MRRIAAVLSPLAIAGTLAVGISTPAFAAHGQLILPNQIIDNPSGCVAGRLRPQIVQNNTNEYALIYGGRNCTGEVLEVVAPGSSTSAYASEFGTSIFVA